MCHTQYRCYPIDALDAAIELHYSCLPEQHSKEASANCMAHPPMECMSSASRKYMPIVWHTTYRCYTVAALDVALELNCNCLPEQRSMETFANSTAYPPSDCMRNTPRKHMPTVRHTLYRCYTIAALDAASDLHYSCLPEQHCKKASTNCTTCPPMECTCSATGKHMPTVQHTLYRCCTTAAFDFTLSYIAAVCQSSTPWKHLPTLRHTIQGIICQLDDTHHIHCH